MTELYSITCPKCSGKEFWKTADRRFKCKKCRYLFTPRLNPLNVSNETLEKIVSEFVLEHSIKIISERVNISKYKLLKTLTLLRELIAKYNTTSINYPTENIKFKKEYFLLKQPVIGIICQEGRFLAEVVPITEIKELKSLKKGIPLSQNLQKYEALAFRGFLYRLKKEKRHHHISTLEGFWGYLKRKLTTKGGIRKEKLHLYLSEYSWRYNHRKLTLKEQEKFLLNLLFQYFKSESR